MPLHLADFLGCAAAHPAVREAAAALPPFPPDARCLLLSGPERSGKTSLLFHAALSLARQNQRVLLLCRRAKLEQVPPLLPEGVPISDPAWARIDIKYISSGYELLRFMSLVHVLGPPPDALLVDDLHTLADLPAAPDRHRPRDMALCRILAAMHEAVDVAAQLNGRPCHLIATELASADGPRQPFILQRWLPLLLHIRPQGDGNVLALLKPKPDVPLACHAQLHFSLKHGVLALDAVHPPAVAAAAAW